MQTKIPQISLQHLDQHVCMCKRSCCVIIRILIVLPEIRPKKGILRKIEIHSYQVFRLFTMSMPNKHFIGMLFFTGIVGTNKIINFAIFLPKDKSGGLNKISVIIIKIIGETTRFTSIQNV